MDQTSGVHTPSHHHQMSVRDNKGDPITREMECTTKDGQIPAGALRRTRSNNGHPGRQPRSPSDPSGRQDQQAHQIFPRPCSREESQGTTRTAHPNTTYSPTRPHHNSRVGRGNYVGTSRNWTCPAPTGATPQAPATNRPHPRSNKRGYSEPSLLSTPSYTITARTGATLIRLNIRGNKQPPTRNQLLGGSALRR